MWLVDSAVWWAQKEASCFLALLLSFSLTLSCLAKGTLASGTLLYCLGRELRKCCLFIMVIFIEEKKNNPIYIQANFYSIYIFIWKNLSWWQVNSINYTFLKKNLIYVDNPFLLCSYKIPKSWQFNRVYVSEKIWLQSFFTFKNLTWPVWPKSRALWLLLEWTLLTMSWHLFFLFL